jgi:hypothetical protein
VSARHELADAVGVSLEQVDTTALGEVMRAASTSVAETSPLRRRRWAHLCAVVFGYSWRECANPGCGQWFGSHEKPNTEHLETIPGGEDDPRILCPRCVDAGIGCRAHAADPDRPYHHDGCEFVPDEIWTDDDSDVAPGRSGPYLLGDPAGRRPSPHPREDEVQPIITVLPEPAVVARLQGRAVQRRIRQHGENSRLLARHRELLASIPDTEENATVRQLLVEHAPTTDSNDELRLMCRGCPPAVPTDDVSLLEARLADAPCPTWSTIARLNRRSA